MRRSDGFTLVEVVVALAILGGIVATALVLLTTSRGGELRATAQLRATLTAESILARVGLDVPLRVGRSSGRLADGARWTIVIAPYAELGLPADPEPPDLLAVTVRVAPGAGGGAAVELDTLKGAP